MTFCAINHVFVSSFEVRTQDGKLVSVALTYTDATRSFYRVEPRQNEMRLTDGVFKQTIIPIYKNYPEVFMDLYRDLSEDEHHKQLMKDIVEEIAQEYRSLEREMGGAQTPASYQKSVSLEC